MRQNNNTLDAGDRSSRRITALAVAWCINTFAYSIAYPFLPIYLHSTRGFPMSQVGLLYLLIGLARMLAPTAGGPLVDRFGRRGMLIAAPAARAVAYLVLAWFVYREAGFWQLSGMLFVVMFIGGFFQTASSAYVTDVAPAQARPEAFSKIRVGLNIGWMAGPAVGAFLARTPFALLFAVTGVLCLVTPVIVFFSCPEPENGGAEYREGAAGGERRGLLSVLGADATFLKMLLFAFPIFLVSSQLVTTLTVFARDHIGMTGNAVGLLYTLNGLVVILFQLRLSKAIVRVNLATRVSSGGLFYAAGYFAMAFCTTAWHAYLAVVVFTVGEMLTFPSLEAASSRMAPPGMVGRYMGIYGLVWGLGYSVGPFMGSLLYGRLADQPVRFWGVIVISALVAAGCFTRMRGVAALQQGEDA